ncbi:hypothetical protein A0H76_1435 [Hepatospora eriocheir]|uniref:Uncharacterized protein n=1 Tax=Hepatospora eriocheir TaxID=1081669 RepID=A0A1X0QH45_9MICR|nr:hypothetical protein A0H76_1435 [Hepatospora eriocheir]
MIINCITKYGKIISYSYKPLDSDSINGNRLLKISEIDLNYFNFPKLISNLTKNIISINNIMIQLSFRNKSGNKLDLLLNLIEKYNRNTCGLLINDYLRDDCMIRRKTLKFIVRRALLEYFNIEIEIQNIINKEMKMSFYEICDLIKEFY